MAFFDWLEVKDTAGSLAPKKKPQQKQGYQVTDYSQGGGTQTQQGYQQQQQPPAPAPQPQAQDKRQASAKIDAARVAARQILNEVFTDRQRRAFEFSDEEKRLLDAAKRSIESRNLQSLAKDLERVGPIIQSYYKQRRDLYQDAAWQQGVERYGQALQAVREGAKFEPAVAGGFPADVEGQAKLSESIQKQADQLQKKVDDPNVGLIERDEAQERLSLLQRQIGEIARQGQSAAKQPQPQAQMPQLGTDEPDAIRAAIRGYGIPDDELPRAISDAMDQLKKNLAGDQISPEKLTKLLQSGMRVDPGSAMATVIQAIDEDGSLMQAFNDFNMALNHPPQKQPTTVGGEGQQPQQPQQPSQADAQIADLKQMLLELRGQDNNGLLSTWWGTILFVVTAFLTGPKAATMIFGQAQRRGSLDLESRLIMQQYQHLLRMKEQEARGQSEARRMAASQESRFAEGQLDRQFRWEIEKAKELWASARERAKGEKAELKALRDKQIDSIGTRLQQAKFDAMRAEAEVENISRTELGATPQTNARLRAAIQKKDAAEKQARILSEALAEYQATGTIK